MSTPVLHEPRPMRGMDGALSFPRLHTVPTRALLAVAEARSQTFCVFSDPSIECLTSPDSSVRTACPELRLVFPRPGYRRVNWQLNCHIWWERIRQTVLLHLKVPAVCKPASSTCTACSRLLRQDTPALGLSATPSASCRARPLSASSISDNFLL
jgi:hypothetical protein